ncbi:MAG: hypothetical protein KH745_09695 [Bilophila sp.]|nr:hypothetical protein [Bilophila sp.]
MIPALLQSGQGQARQAPGSILLTPLQMNSRGFGVTLKSRIVECYR